VEDPHQTLLGQQLSADFELPLVSNVGYETPGSFGSWCADLSLPCITLELPAISADLASEKYLPALLALIDYDL
jgi:protein MpaA